MPRRPNNAEPARTDITIAMASSVTAFQPHAAPLMAVQSACILVCTAVPRSVKIATTNAVTKPPATAYSTTVSPSSSFANFTTALLIACRSISATSLAN
ncbi:hypothetical protein D3C78_1493230 [compost metagenome]